MFIIFGIISSVLFISDKSTYFEKVQQQVDAGAEWSYVGRTAADPDAEQIFTFPSEKGLKTILFKLK
tara:strand:- start:432 stop:632 length:201 start_codon:yes stop_codon:yes gene_type:complete